MVLCHVIASWVFERYDWGLARAGTWGGGVAKPEGERSSVPRSEGRRTWYYVLFTLGLSTIMVGIKMASLAFGLNIWMCEFFFSSGPTFVS